MGTEASVFNLLQLCFVFFDPTSFDTYYRDRMADRSRWLLCVCLSSSSVTVSAPKSRLDNSARNPQDTINWQESYPCYVSAVYPIIGQKVKCKPIKDATQRMLHVYQLGIYRKLTGRCRVNSPIVDEMR